MKLFVGLGNLGRKYEYTRHNVGFLILDQIAEKIGGHWSNDKRSVSLIVKHNFVLLSKPQTFMNDSGITVSKLITFYKVKSDDVYIVHDDLDIKLGEFKVQKATGPKVHNGINSIEEKLGTKDFWRIRVGVDNRQPENRTPGEDYVLQKFTDTELVILKDVIKNVVSEIAVKLNE